MLYKHLVKPFVYTTSYGLLWVIALQLKTIITLLEEFKADSEIEAVIKASEYILKEINENR